MKRNIIIIISVVIIIIGGIFVFGASKSLHKDTQAPQFYSIDDVKSIKIRPESWGSTYSPSLRYIFNLSKPEQKNNAVNILDLLNSTSNKMSVIPQEAPKNSSGVNTCLYINYKNGMSITINNSPLYGSDHYKIKDRLIIDGYYEGKSLLLGAEDCPQLVQYLESDWKNAVKDMKKVVQ